jgi:glycosyltransferase involved in cell wall biosynthesis
MKKFIEPKDHHLLDSITFLGYLSNEDMSQLYAGTSIVLAPSLYEGFGRSVAEAIIYRKPVVCYDQPVYREFFEDIPYYATTIEDFIACIDEALISHVAKLPKNNNLYSSQLTELRNILCCQ